MRGMAMNILFLDQFSMVGGGQRSLLELLPLIHARGWSARVALPGRGPYSEKVRASGFPVDFIPCGEYPKGRKGFADAAARIRSVISIRLGPLREVAEQARAVCREKYGINRFQREVGDVIAQAFSRTTARNRNAAAIATHPDATRTGG